MIKKLTIGLFAALLIAAPAFALTKTTTVQSEVTIENPEAPVQQRIIRIKGPDGSDLRLMAPAPEIQRIVTMVDRNPDMRLSFNGEVVTEGGSQVFKMQNFKETTVTQSQGINSAGSSVSSQTKTERTETETQRVP